MSDGVTLATGVSASAQAGEILLWMLRGANMQLTTDQPFTKMFSGTRWDPQSGSTVVNARTGAFNTACVGGVYMGAGKTGTQIVAASQSYAGLTAPDAQVHPAIVANNVTQVGGNPILSLTTGNSAALTADFFIYGACLDS